MGAGLLCHEGVVLLSLQGRYGQRVSGRYHGVNPGRKSSCYGGLLLLLLLLLDLGGLCLLLLLLQSCHLS